MSMQENIEALMLRETLAGAPFKSSFPESVVADSIILELEINTGKDYVKQKLKIIKEKSNRDSNLRYLAQEFVLGEVIRPLEQIAIDQMYANNLEEFIEWHDVWFGAGQIASIMKSAEIGLNGNFRPVLEAAEIVEGATGTDEPDEKLKIYTDTVKIAQAAASLVIKDPSGFQLVDEAAKFVRGDDNRLASGPPFTYQRRTFVLKGAETAAEVYKTAYEIGNEGF